MSRTTEKNQKLLLVEAEASMECWYDTDYDLRVQLTTREVTINELLQTPWFVRELEQRGWGNLEQAKQLSEKLTHSARFYVLPDMYTFGDDCYGSAYRVDPEKLTKQEQSRLSQPNSILVQEVNLEHLAEIDPVVYEAREKSIKAQRAAEKKAVALAEAKKKAKAAKEEAKKRRKVEEAKKLLEQEGIKVPK
jgi:hypothetical protein